MSIVWTSKISGLQMQAERLSIRQAEAKKQQVAERQWVKPPVAGLGADIRLVEVVRKVGNLQAAGALQRP